MTEKALTLKLDEELSSAFLQLAERRQRRPLDLLRELVSDELALSDEDWFRREVERALNQADDPSTRLYSTEEVEEIFAERRAAVTRACAEV